jgi:hypothetical protein
MTKVWVRCPKCKQEKLIVIRNNKYFRCCNISHQIDANTIVKSYYHRQKETKNEELTSQNSEQKIARKTVKIDDSKEMVNIIE